VAGSTAPRGARVRARRSIKGQSAFRERPTTLPQPALREDRAMIQKKIKGEKKAKETRTKARKRGGRYGDAGALRNVKSA